MSTPEGGEQPKARQQRPDASWLIEKFLGASARERGPFGLLGLRAANVDEDDVLAGLRARLQQTATHPEGFTPEADEVRLAIHAAAAQLLDPATRKSMLDRWGADAESASPAAVPSASPVSTKTIPAPVGPARRPPVAAPSGPGAAVGAAPHPPSRLAPLDRDVLLIQHEAVRAIAACGGWNERARSHLQMFSHARGIPAQTLLLAVSHLDQPHSGGPPRAVVDPTPLAATPSRLAAEPRRGLPPALVWAMVLAGVVCVGILVGVAVLAANAGRKPKPVVAATPDQPAPVRDTSTQAFPWKPDPSRPAPTIPAAATTDVQRWIQDLSAAIDATNQGAEGAFDAMLTTLRSGATRWPELSGPDLTVVQRCVVDAMYLAEEPERALLVLQAISPPGAARGTDAAQSLIREIWAAAMLNRISRERDLPAAVLDAVERELSRHLDRERPIGDPAFEAGAIAALRLEAEDAATSASDAVWDAWVRAATAIGTLQPARRTDVLLSGLARASGGVGDRSPAPATDKVGAANVRAIGLIVPLIAWHREPIAQRWLLAQFDAFDTRPAALNAIAREMATRSSVPGVDATMILPEAFTEVDRRDLRDRYARLFGIDVQESRSEVDERWVATFQALRSREPTTGSMIGSLDAALAWSRLSEAAWLHWRGVPDRSLQVLKDIEATPAYVPSQRSTRSDTLRRDEAPEWTQRYLGAGSDIAARVSLLGAFPSGDPHPADAEVALAEALRGSPVQVREAARAVVDRHAASAPMVNAMLEALPTAPRTVSTADIIASLTGLERVPLDTPEWRAVARQALVERLLRTLAGRGELAEIDSIALRLAASHAVRAASPGPAQPSESAALIDLASSLSQQRETWRIACEDLVRPRTYPDSLASIDADLAGRLRVAEGAIQRAVAEECAIVRLMAIVVVCERPERTAEVESVVAQAAIQVSQAPNVMDQILVCERSLAELWAIRLGEGEPP